VISGCSIGGVNYEEGEWFLDNCAQKCLCANGQARRCTRVRKELLTMDRVERAHYWNVFKIVYADPDGVLQRYIVDHVTFFFSWFAQQWCIFALAQRLYP